MTFFEALVLALVEGITEFLPISSTGHLVLTAHLLRIEQTEFVKTFEIVIQLGAILAVVFLYWRTLLQGIEIWKKILIAFAPTAIVGLTFYKLIKDVLLENTLITVLALLFGGVALIILEILHKEKVEHKNSIQDVSMKQAFFIGLFQSISIVPGVSRAGATIMGALFLGVRRKAAVEFSFLLAIPTMLSATLYDVYKTNITFVGEEFMLLSVGFIGSFVIAAAVVKFLVRYVEKYNFIPFGIYRIVLGILFFILFIA